MLVSGFRNKWTTSPVILRATLLAAWSASKVGAISLAVLFATVNLAFGVYEIAEGHMKIAELPALVVGSATVLFSHFYSASQLPFPQARSLRRARIRYCALCAPPIRGRLVLLVSWLGHSSG
jgi:hypothetical protein